MVETFRLGGRTGMLCEDKLREKGSGYMTGRDRLYTTGNLIFQIVITCFSHFAFICHLQFYVIANYFGCDFNPFGDGATPSKRKK